MNRTVFHLPNQLDLSLLSAITQYLRNWSTQHNYLFSTTTENAPKIKKYCDLYHIDLPIKVVQWGHVCFDEMKNILQMLGSKKRIFKDNYTVATTDNTNFDTYQNIYLTERFFPVIAPYHDYVIWLFDYKKKHNLALSNDEKSNWLQCSSYFMENIRGASKIYVNQQNDYDCVLKHTGVVKDKIVLIDDLLTASPGELL